MLVQEPFSSATFITFARPKNEALVHEAYP